MPDDQQGDTSVLTSLFRHNTWANLKLLDVCEGLSDDQLEATTVGTYGAIRATLLHIVFGEVGYVHRVTDGWPPVTRPPQDVFPGFAWLKDAVRWSGDELNRLAVAARAETLVKETFQEEHVAVEYPLSSLMLQAINHATEHRTQILAILTELGIEPPDLSGWRYMEETGEYRERRLDAEAGGTA